MLSCEHAASPIISVLSYLLVQCRIGQPFSGTQELHKLFSQYDTNQSGQLEFNEFLVLFKDRLQDLQKTLRFIRMKPAKSQSIEPSVIQARKRMCHVAVYIGNTCPLLCFTDQSDLSLWTQR